MSMNIDVRYFSNALSLTEFTKKETTIRVVSIIKDRDQWVLFYEVLSYGPKPHNKNEIQQAHDKAQYE